VVHLVYRSRVSMVPTATRLRYQPFNRWCIVLEEVDGPLNSAYASGKNYDASVKANLKNGMVTGGPLGMGWDGSGLPENVHALECGVRA
jgi:hypothetical protein